MKHLLNRHIKFSLLALIMSTSTMANTDRFIGKVHFGAGITHTPLKMNTQGIRATIALPAESDLQNNRRASLLDRYPPHAPQQYISGAR
ncbi:hypothetical protein MNBD_GAMMA11-2854 [hydrothermal vent metagenome]|uniref:Uncharacterized protein n=1 Tax=hydrothermal vent metagenome TaxID=652676 RepID=A0A3B0YB34_9ZZZZ